MYAIADLTAPNGQRLEGAGVAPDEAVPLTRADLLAGRDGPLQAAVRWIGSHGDGKAGSR
jgi:C-terminal processing protease CtpA/Prc